MTRLQWINFQRQLLECGTLQQRAILEAVIAGSAEGLPRQIAPLAEEILECTSVPKAKGSVAVVKTPLKSS